MAKEAPFGLYVCPANIRTAQKDCCHGTLHKVNMELYNINSKKK